MTLSTHRGRKGFESGKAKKFIIIIMKMKPPSIKNDSLAISQFDRLEWVEAISDQASRV